MEDLSKLVAFYQLRETQDFILRRMKGEYQTDPYGLDPEIIELMRPLLRFFYRTYWRVKVEGLEHVPATGRGLLVANHSGVLPWDGAMVATAIAEDHPAQRVMRNTFLHWFSELPFVSPLFVSLGCISGLPENAIRLLEEDQLVCSFPEGVKGIGKLYKDRYQLARFGRGGFVQVALKTGAPLIPVAVVGAEEIYPMLTKAKPIARLLKLPFCPITPFFPLLGPLGTVPVPSRWKITFCPPIPTATYGPAAADDPLIVFELAEKVRSTIQNTLNQRPKTRWPF